MSIDLSRSELSECENQDAQRDDISGKKLDVATLEPIEYVDGFVLELGDDGIGCA